MKFTKPSGPYIGILGFLLILSMIGLPNTKNTEVITNTLSEQNNEEERDLEGAIAVNTIKILKYEK